MAQWQRKQSGQKRRPLYGYLITVFFNEPGHGTSLNEERSYPRILMCIEIGIGLQSMQPRGGSLRCDAITHRAEYWFSFQEP
jgi:hypothetical protein